MLRMLEAQAPAKQTATDTISTLSSRLNNATLLEDRRGAILGLRSFAKEYPASVASGSLRSLIGCLAKELDDVDTTKVVLETLLMLFNPNEQSPEAGEEIALWLADEFTQRQENIKVLLDLLETTEFYSRLYSLQLISAIFSARPERTQECVLNAALGTSRLVATLDDRRDAVRNAGLLLLGDLTQSSTELQKLVAFESTFDRVFQLLQLEGGLSQGGIIVQDCLDLLANLIRQNSSNQSLFRESGCVPKLAELLKSAYTLPDGDGQGDADEFPNPQRDKNLWGLLAVIRLFIVNGSAGTHLNQKIFVRHGLLQQILDLPFRETTEVPIRAEALYTCADIIRGNPELQASFAQLQVPTLGQSSLHHPQTNGKSNGIVRIYIIDALLDLVIVPSSVTTFNVRLAACECIKAYFFNHVQIRLHFLNRAINGHSSGEDETANVLSTLVREGAEQVGDPSRLWFAAVILLHLIRDDRDAKRLLMKVSEGDADSGEEVVTCIQAIAGNLIAGIQRDEDERLLIGYLMLLCGWLYEDSAAVDDFLQEGSLLQSLVQTVSAGNGSAVVKGLAAVLIGIVYEYSTKDSPIPRRKIQPILTTGLGREQYLQALSQLRQHPLVRDYEVFSQQSASAHQSSDLPPYAYFDSTFIEFLKDNFSRFSRAIDRDPGLEVQIPSGEQEGIDRDLVDSLRSQISDKNTALEKAETRLLALEQRLDQDQASHRKDMETTATELQRTTQAAQAQQVAHAADTAALQAQHQAALHTAQTAAAAHAQQLTDQLAVLRRSTADDAERTKDYYERLLAQARGAKTNLDARLASAQRSVEELTRTIEEARKTVADLQSENASWKRAVDTIKASSERKERKIADLEASATQHRETAEDEKTKVSLLEKEVADLEARLEAERAVTKEKEEAKAAIQTELDDLLMVFGDVEEKRARDKKRLKALGEEVSDADDEDEDDEEEDVD